MPTLLCLTRGGPASYANQDGVIELAKERDASLVFLFVSNVEFLGQMAAPIPVDMETELEHLGEFLLAMAQERAQKAGIEAEAIIKQGELDGALREAVEEHQPDMVAFGSPGERTDVLTRSYLDDLAESLSQEFGIEVFFLREGEIERHIPGAQSAP